MALEKENKYIGTQTESSSFEPGFGAICNNCWNQDQFLSTLDKRRILRSACQSSIPPNTLELIDVTYYTKGKRYGNVQEYCSIQAKKR